MPVPNNPPTARRWLSASRQMTPQHVDGMCWDADCRLLAGHGGPHKRRVLEAINRRNTAHCRPRCRFIAYGIDTQAGLIYKRCRKCYRIRITHL